MLGTLALDNRIYYNSLTTRESASSLGIGLEPIAHLLVLAEWGSFQTVSVMCSPVYNGLGFTRISKSTGDDGLTLNL